ncbi:MAG: MMPL family transporter [Gammaproteobacteria bacterium]|nr:MMPL family transporter [Gammaproteobacteria bacterium]
MQVRIRQRWMVLLVWVADRPRGSAVAATLLLALVATLIRPPLIEGSMVDQLAGSNVQLEIAREISAASGAASAAAVIVSPADVSISAVFGGLAKLEQRLVQLDSRISLRSIDAARDQLFVYDLTSSDRVADLLAVLRDNPAASTIIARDATRFLIVVQAPENLELQVIDILNDYDWREIATQTTVLASAQLERDVVAGLEKDLRLLLPVIVGTTLVALFVAFGYWRALLLPLFASISSTLVTFALFSATVVTINLITLLALPVVLIVGLANSCHFLARSETDLSSGEDVDEAIRVTMRRVGPPFFFSSLTTAIALASLGLNELPPIANFGLLSAGALLIVFLLVLLAAPLSLRWYLQGSGASWQASRHFAALSRLLATWRTHIGALLLLAMIAGAVSLPLLSVKSEPRAFFPDDAPFSSALRMFENEFYLFSPLRVLVFADGAEPLPMLRSAGALRDALAELPATRQVTMEPAADRDDAYVISALLASEDHLAEVRRLIDGAALGDGVMAIYSNASLVYGDIDRQAMGSLLRSLGWSVLLIFGAIWLAFGSARATLSAMLANAVPLMLVCGAVWLIGNPLNLVSVFVFLVALGVIVDDSIHLLFWRAAGDSISGSSIEFSVILSTVVLCLGLLLCQLSDFPTTRQFAAYCALALVGAVVSNLSVLPLMLGSSQPRAASA